MAKEGGNKDTLFKKYEDIISRYPDNHVFKYDYAYELYKYAYDTSLAKRPANSPELIQKALTNVNGVIKTKQITRRHIYLPDRLSSTRAWIYWQNQKRLRAQNPRM